MILRITAQMDQPGQSRNSSKKIDWFGFCVRFVCGATLGIFLSIRFALYFWPSEGYVTLVIASIVAVLGCGLLAARYGDEFWRSILQRSWFE